MRIEDRVGWRRTVGEVALEPALHVEDVALLGPQQTRQGLALDAAFVLGRLRGVDRGVELIGLLSPPVDDGVDLRERLGQAALVGEAKPQHRRTARGHVEAIVERRLGAGLRRVDAVLAADDVAVEGVLDERRAAVTAGAEDALAMGLVVGEERSAAARGVERARPQPVEDRNVAEGFHGGVVADQAQRVRGGGAKADARLRAGRRRPAPGVAEPQVRQDVQGRGRWARD